MLENDHNNVMTKQMAADCFIFPFVKTSRIEAIITTSNITLAILSIKDMTYNGHSTAHVEITV